MLKLSKMFLLKEGTFSLYLLNIHVCGVLVLGCSVAANGEDRHGGGCEEEEDVAGGGCSSTFNQVLVGRGHNFKRTI